MMEDRISRIFGERAKYLTEGERRAAEAVLEYEDSNGPVSGVDITTYEMDDVVRAVKSVLKSEFDTTMDDVMHGGRSRNILYLRYCILVCVSRLTEAPDRLVVEATGNGIDRSNMIHVRRSFDEQMAYSDFNEKYHTLFNKTKAILDKWTTGGKQ